MISRPTFLMAKATWIDFSRRKDSFVLLSLSMLFAIGAIVVRVIGVTNDSTSRLLLSCGLGLSSTLSAILVALFASRAMPEEMENRTLYPLLAKPVSRGQVLIAKFLGIYSISLLAFFCFLALAWLPVPKMSNGSSILLLQGIVLQALSLAGLCWLAMLLSMQLPSLVSGLIALLVWFMAAPVVDFSTNLMGASSANWGRMWSHAAGIIPDWSALRFFQAYVDGASALDIVAFAGLALYACTFAVLFAAIAIQCFDRKAL